MPEWDPSRTWYHGSPLTLSVLRAGSTVTQDRGLARVFSHRPTIVCIEDDGRIRHSGQQPGILYRLVGPLADPDLVPHPNSTMADGLEWLTTRDLEVSRIERTVLRPEELLSEEDVARLVGRAAGP
jgi:hypothetical protein